MRIARRRVPAGVVLGRRTCIRGIEEAALGSGTQVKSEAVVVAHTVILGVVDCAKTLIEPRRERVPSRSDQIARNGIDIDAIRNLAAKVTVANQIGGMGTAVKRAGDKMAANSMFKRRRKNVRSRGHNVRVNSADG